MMRKIAIVIFSCLLFLCSCSTDSTTYKNQELIAMNYNNITNYCDFWLTTDSICYLEDSLIQKYFMVEKNSKTKIGVNNGYGFGKIQKYEEKIYMLDMVSFINERNSKYELKLYDIDSKTIKKVCSVMNCENFLVLDEVIYYLENSWVDDVPTLTLKKFSIDLEEHTTIRSSVVSFGVIEDSLCYVVKDNNRIVIFKYNAESGASVKCGEFLLDEDNTKMFDGFFFNNLRVSYTRNTVFFSSIDYENETSTIFSYSFQQNALSNRKVEGYIEGFVSYNDNSYFIISSEKSNNSELYKLNNKTDEITKITEIQGEGSLFVGSDEGVYVLRNKDNNLVFYSNEGNTQVVYEF